MIHVPAGTKISPAWMLATAIALSKAVVVGVMLAVISAGVRG
jgi:hypothetical protein